MTTRCGLVAVLGAPNAGKSTLVNALVGQKVAIVSPKAQTTRARLMGIAIEGGSQMMLVDTPGIFTPNRRLDRAMVDAQQTAPRHPKSLLLEWAEGQGRRPPDYEVIEQSGPPHAPRFTVRASVRGLGSAEGQGTSKQDAETAAAAALLEQLQ